MTSETIEWFSPEKYLPKCTPGTQVLVILQDGRCVLDQYWNPQAGGFIVPDRNTMMWNVVNREMIKLWAYLPKGNDNPIFLPGSMPVNHQVKRLR